MRNARSPRHLAAALLRAIQACRCPGTRKRGWCLSVAFCVVLCTMSTEPAPATQGTVQEITHFSEAHGREATFSIFLPDAEPDARFPVLYMLHGAYGNHRDWLLAGNAAGIASHYRMIVVFPDGGQFGWYVDSPHEADSQYATYVAKELVDYVDAHFPTIPSREARGIMGLSMGGHGAMILAANNPERFGSASALSGILKITDHPDKYELAQRLGPQEENPQLWEANSVWDQAERFLTADIRILFDCGEDDVATGAISDSRKLHARLAELRVPHIWREHTGNHTWDYWSSHLQDHLNFHQAAMIEADPGADRWFRLFYERLSEFLDQNARLTLERPDEEPILVLLGSSSLQDFPDSLFPGFHVENRAIAGDGLGIGERGLTTRLEESVFDVRPDIVVIKNGRNDLGDLHRHGFPTVEAMLEAYARMLDQIEARSPKTRVVIITAFPVAGRYAHLADSVVEYNQGLLRLAEERGLELIDAWPMLAGEDGLLRDGYSADGLHLTTAGRDKVAATLLRTLNTTTPTTNPEETE